MSKCPHRVQQLKTCPFPEDISGISSEVSLVISVSGCILIFFADAEDDSVVEVAGALHDEDSF